MLNIPEKGDGADDDASSLQGDTKKETADSWQRRTHNVLFRPRLAYDPTIAEFLIRDQSRFSHFFPLKQSSNKCFRYLYLTPVLEHLNQFCAANTICFHSWFEGYFLYFMVDRILNLLHGNIFTRYIHRFIEIGQINMGQ